MIRFICAHLWLNARNETNCNFGLIGFPQRLHPSGRPASDSIADGYACASHPNVTAKPPDAESSHSQAGGDGNQDAQAGFHVQFHGNIPPNPNVDL